MGLFDFVSSVGEKLFGAEKKETDQERSAKLETHVRRLGLEVEQLKVDVKGDVATVAGHVEPGFVRGDELLDLAAGSDFDVGGH